MNNHLIAERRPLHAVSGQELLPMLEVDAGRGLSSDEAERRLQIYGPNQLHTIQPRNTWAILVEQFKSLVVLLLAMATGLSFVFRDWEEGIAILVVIFLNATIGFVTEVRAVRSMEALRRLGGVTARVRRDGHVREISAEELVPGDIVLLEAGDLVSADIRLLEASKLQADESTFTGESLPVEKSTQPVAEDAPLAERSNMLFKGTALTRGSAVGVVTATGMDTELGHITSLVTAPETESTSYERQLDALSRQLIWVVLLIVALIAGVGILQGKELYLMVQTGVALAVASIPEGLPIVATVALARGMWRMARRHALVNRLSAFESLGSVNVLLVDKTGTLTENRMTLTRIVLECCDVGVNGERLALEGPLTGGEGNRAPCDAIALRRVLEVGVLCNNASVHHDEVTGAMFTTGDPLEVALLMGGMKAGIHPEHLRQQWPEVREEAFDSATKMMATFHHDEDGYRVAVKGAPESVLRVCTRFLAIDGEREMQEEDRHRWLGRNQQMAEQGIRVLAMAEKRAESPDAAPYEGLTFLGLVGLSDPLRPESRQAVEACREAGIRVVMVTGDQAATARAIGQAVGLVGESSGGVMEGRNLLPSDLLTEAERTQILQATVFARVTPRQKLELVGLHRQNGAVVAMTGDGVNDAPALKHADIGIAMGQRGTQVAREAADIVLKDDSLATIVAAIEQGRAIVNNIRRCVFYLLSCNMSEVMIVALAASVNAPLPILPLQILFLNLVTDVFPALALGLGEGDPTLMRRPPHAHTEPVIDRQGWVRVAGYGTLMTATTLVAFALALGRLQTDIRHAVTISFLTLAFAQLWHVFNMRDPGSHFFHNDVTKSFHTWGALGTCTVLLLLVVYVPGLNDLMRVSDPGWQGWLLALGMSVIPLVIGQVALHAFPRGNVEGDSPMKRIFCLVALLAASSLAAPTRAENDLVILRAQGHPNLVDFLAVQSKRADLRGRISQKGLDVAFSEWLRRERPLVYWRYTQDHR
jgi:Ca2+-transporting ATPase